MLLPFSLAERFDAIKKGLLNKKLINNILYYSCYSTYIGFLNSFRENKIYTAKVKINNEYRRVFIKTPVHNGLGANPMFLDPKNGKVYAFSTDNKGNIKKFILRIDPKKGHIYNNIEKPIPLMSVEKLALKKLESEIENYVKKTLENQKRHRSEIIKKRNTKKVIKRVTLRK